MNIHVKRLLMKAAAKERNWMDEYQADPEKTMQTIDKTVPSTGFESHPLVSVQQGEAIFVEFKQEARLGKNKENKETAYADVIILAPTPNGWDSGEKRQINLNEGDVASINLKRHANLWRGAEAHAPLAGKRFMIANMQDKVKTKRGYACDYRFVVLE